MTCEGGLLFATSNQITGSQSDTAECSAGYTFNISEQVKTDPPNPHASIYLKEAIGKIRLEE